MSIPRFSFYTYVDKIKELVADGFPVLNSVSFQPSEDGDDAKYSDVGVPAFLMSFDDPEVLGGVMRNVDLSAAPTDDHNKLLSTKTGYFMNIRVNVQGSLILPRFKTAGQNADDLNMSIAVFQAATNIAALINAKAGTGAGWNCEPAKIGDITYAPDSDYHIAIVEWSHEAVVGREAGDENDLLRVYADDFVCPDDDTDTADLTVAIVDDNLIFEEE